MSFAGVVRSTLRRFATGREDRCRKRHENYLDGRIAALQSTAIGLHGVLHEQVQDACVAIARAHIVQVQLRYSMHHLHNEDAPRWCACKSQAPVQSFEDFCARECAVLLSKQSLALEFESSLVSDDVLDEAMAYARDTAASPGLPPLAIVSYLGDTILTFDVRY